MSVLTICFSRYQLSYNFAIKGTKSAEALQNYIQPLGGGDSDL